MFTLHFLRSLFQLKLCANKLCKFILHLCTLDLRKKHYYFLDNKKMLTLNLVLMKMIMLISHFQSSSPAKSARDRVKPVPHHAKQYNNDDVKIVYLFIVIY